MIDFEYTKKRILEDLYTIGLPVTFDLSLKPYSKTFYGKYVIPDNRVLLYVYTDKGCTIPFSYLDLLLIAIHEGVHAIQWHDPYYIRVKGVMHDSKFWELYNKYSDRAKALILLREVNRTNEESV